MLRFNYEGKDAIVKVDGQVEFVDEGSIPIDEKILLEHCQQKEITSYTELLNIIRKETRSKTEKFYYTFYSDGYFMLAVKEMAFDTFVKAFYKPENEAIEDALKKYIGLEDESAKLIIGSHKNSFNFITANPILDLLFEDALLKYRGEPKYTKFKIKKKKDGKVPKGTKPAMRQITAPHDALKKPLKEVNKILQYVFDRTNDKFQVAYKKGKSTVDNTDPHKEYPYLFNIDLSDFFPSCTREFVKKYTKIFFKNAPNREVVEEAFLDIILDDETDALYIGNPISGTLANAIISKPVKYIKNITKGFDMGFTVYADDMSFSSNRYISEEFVNNIFNLAFMNYDMEDFFHINKKKSHGMSKQRRRITGISINESNQRAVPRKFYRNLRVKIHKLSIGELSINLQKLQGQISYAMMVDETGKVERLLEKFESTVLLHKLVSVDKMAEIRGAV